MTEDYRNKQLNLKLGCGSRLDRDSDQDNPAMLDLTTIK
jgi:hypothetical protein